MVEIRYGDHYEQAELASKSVAKARERYQEEFGIPDRARAILNGKLVKKDMEPRTMLSDNDELSFEAMAKSGRGLVLVAALALAIAITGGVFAYTYTTASATITGVADSDFAAIEPSSPAVSFSTNVFGKFRGDLPEGYLFDITPDTDYTGDLTVDVYLTNVDELTLAYKHINLKLELWDSATTPVNINASATGHTFELLTLDNGVVHFDLAYDTGTTPYKVKIAGGGFRTHGRSPLDWTSGFSASPLLFCEVVQR